MKNILVTGGAGFVGTNLIKKLVNQGHRVLSIDNYSTGTRENEIDGCKYWDFDLSDDTPFDEILLTMQIKKIDCIYHLAALARIQPSLVHPDRTIKNNFISTLNILEYARLNNVQVIYSGSSSYHHGLYGSPYSWSKWTGEELCKLYSRVYDINTSICRFYNVYGPHQILTGDYAAVVGIFQHQFLNNQLLTITGNGEQRRDFTHVSDITDALILLMTKNNRADIFELGRGKNHSINELADMFGLEKTYLPPRKGEYDKTLCDYTVAHERLGWQPSLDLNDYINEWLQTNNINKENNHG